MSKIIICYIPGYRPSFSVKISQWDFDIKEDGDVVSFPRSNYDHKEEFPQHRVPGLTHNNWRNMCDNLTTFAEFFEWSKQQKYPWTAKQLNYLKKFLKNKSDKAIVAGELAI